MTSQHGSIGALAVAPSDPEHDLCRQRRRPAPARSLRRRRHLQIDRRGPHLAASRICATRNRSHPSSSIPKIPIASSSRRQGHPYGPNPERGVFRSLDGGQTFQKVLYKDENVGGMDLVFDPRNSQIIFASMWSSRRPPWTTGGGYTGPGSGLYKSTDGGNTWRQLTKGLPGEAEGIGRIGPAVSPSDPDRMYAWVNCARKAAASTAPMTPAKAGSR